MTELISYHNSFYVQGHAWGLKTLIARIKDNFHAWVTNPDNLFFNTWLITKLNLIFPKIFQKAVQFYHNTLKCAQLGCRSIFGHKFFSNVWKSAENCWKCSEIPVMTRQKPHAYDSEKVGRCNLVLIFRGNKMANFC